MSSELHKSWRLYRSNLGPYMSRWIARWPLGTFRIHNIRQSDEGRDLHDHPFTFLSLILKGGYLEHRPGCLCTIPISDPTANSTPVEGGPCKVYRAGDFVFRKATDLHRLELVNGEAWTAVVTGRYFRMWGFQTRKGWIPFQEYDRSYYTGDHP